jgi:hypothetical protein
MLAAILLSTAAESRAQQPPPSPAVQDGAEDLANWEVDEDRWTVPINLIFAKLSSFGVFPASYQLGVGGFAAHPEIGPSWKVRGAIVILLPRRQ